MKRIPKQEYTVQFKEQAVAMVKNGKSVAEVARVLGVVEQTLRNWVKLVKEGKLRAGAKEVTAEQMELSRLRAENAQLKLENEILKKATAYFAKDALPRKKGRMVAGYPAPAGPVLERRVLTQSAIDLPWNH